MLEKLEPAISYVIMLALTAYVVQGNVVRRELKIMARNRRVDVGIWWEEDQIRLLIFIQWTVFQKDNISIRCAALHYEAKYPYSVQNREDGV
jgi:hypothetical protein